MEFYVFDFIIYYYFDIYFLGNDKLIIFIFIDFVFVLFILEMGCFVFFMVEWVLGLVVCLRKRDYFILWIYVVSFVFVFVMLMNFLMEFFKFVLVENEVVRWLYFIFKVISMVWLFFFICVVCWFSVL